MAHNDPYAGLNPHRARELHEQRAADIERTERRRAVLTWLVLACIGLVIIWQARVAMNERAEFDRVVNGAVERSDDLAREYLDD